MPDHLPLGWKSWHKGSIVCLSRAARQDILGWGCIPGVGIQQKYTCGIKLIPSLLGTCSQPCILWFWCLKRLQHSCNPQLCCPITGVVKICNTLATRAITSVWVALCFVTGEMYVLIGNKSQSETQEMLPLTQHFKGHFEESTAWSAG